MKVAIVIPAYNRKDVTLKCLKAIYENLPVSFRVILVDSGSSDGTQSAARENYPDTIIIQGQSSDWWAGATNRGIDQAIELGCQSVVTYNDDNVATPDLFAKLSGAAESHPNAIISSAVCYLDAKDKIYFAGRRRAKLTDRFIYMNLNQDYRELEGGLREVDLLHGMCTLFPVSVFQTVGQFDENTFPHLFADDDLVLRAKGRGYRLLVDLDAMVFNDHTRKGLNPYDRRLAVTEIFDLVTSRKSVFQISTRTRFLWRHRRSLVTFIITWLADYSRLAGIILLRWLLPPGLYSKVEKLYLTIRAA